MMSHVQRASEALSLGDPVWPLTSRGYCVPQPITDSAEAVRS